MGRVPFPVAFVSVASAAFLGSALPVHAATLTLLAEDNNPPANFTDPSTGRFVGTSTEIVERMMAAVGIDYTIEALPWGRAYQMTLRGENTCLFSTNRTPEREPLFKWVGPMTSGGWALFARADSSIQPMRSVEEARPYTIGTRVNDAVETYLLSTAGLHIESVSNIELNIKKLESRRIDLWATGTLMGPYLARQERLKIKPVLLLRESEVSLACNLSVSDETIVKLNAALEGLRRDGTIEKIIERNL